MTLYVMARNKREAVDHWPKGYPDKRNAKKMLKRWKAINPVTWEEFNLYKLVTKAEKVK